MPAIRVAIDQIIADPTAWPRRGLDAERVDEFAEKYGDEGLDALPPLEVVDCGPTNGQLLGDGWHRYAALRRLGAPEVPVVVVNAQGRDGRVVAYEVGLRTAAVSSKPLTRSERRDATLRLLVEGGRTDREIGRTVGVSHQTVGRIRDAAGGPMNQAAGESAGGYPPTADLLSARLVRDLERIWDGRGLTDVALRRMPGTLAVALVSKFGSDAALVWARRLASWAERAVTELEGR